MASLLQGPAGSAAPHCSWHSSTGKWKLARRYSWLSTCRPEQQTWIREASGVRVRARAGATVTPPSSAGSGGRGEGSGARLKISLLRVSLSSSTEPDWLVMSSLNTTPTSLSRTPKDSRKGLERIKDGRTGKLESMMRKHLNTHLNINLLQLTLQLTLTFQLALTQQPTITLEP